MFDPGATAAMSETRAQQAGAPIQFALSRGGAVFWVLKKIGLEPEGRRAVIAALLLPLIAWLPLLLLSLKDHLAIGDHVTIPFLKDVRAYCRFLVAVPLLILAGPAIDARLGAAISRLVEGGVIPAGKRSEFDRALSRLNRSRDSWLPELVILTLVVALAWLEVTQGVPSVVTGWLGGAEQSHLTAAGWWYTLVSLPIFLVLAMRWLWRIFLWARFLKRIAGLDLELIPTHPDGVGGLGVLSEAAIGLNLVVAAFSITLGGAVATRMLYFGETLESSQWAIGAFVVIAALLFLGPLLVFSPALGRARFKGLLDYGDLADDYVRAFDHKWLGRSASRNSEGDRVQASGEVLLGSGDVQSLADIGGSFQRVAQMRVILVTPRIAALLVVAALGPMLAPLSAVVPVVQILEKLLQLIGR